MLRVLLVVFFIWPLVHVAMSPRTQGSAKFGWFALVFLFSWLAYPIYLIVTHKNRPGKK